MSVTIFIKRLRSRGEKDLPLPSYQSEFAAGMDLMADLESPVELAPGARQLIPTGLAFEIPAGYEVQLRPRSGLAIRNGITLLNSPGTIDADYRGEVQVILINLGQESFTIKHGDRIAQMIVSPVSHVHLSLSENLGDTKRSSGGFGSTGV